MPTTVRIPTPLRKLTNNEELVEVGAATVGEAIVELQTRFPGIQERLVDEKRRGPLLRQRLCERGRHPLPQKPRDAAQRR